MKKENQKLIKFLQESLKEGKTKISEIDLEKHGAKLSVKTQAHRNIKLEKGFLGDWKISVINPLKDIYGNLISENEDFYKKIKSLLNNDKTEISYKTLLDLNIYTPNKTLIIGNVKLTPIQKFKTSIQPGISIYYESYMISLYDQKKNIDGKWIDKAISAPRIEEALESFKLASRNIKKLTEKGFELKLLEHLKIYFENVRNQVTIDKIRIDLLLGYEKKNSALK